MLPGSSSTTFVDGLTGYSGAVPMRGVEIAFGTEREEITSAPVRLRSFPARPGCRKSDHLRCGGRRAPGLCSSATVSASRVGGSCPRCRVVAEAGFGEFLSFGTVSSKIMKAVASSRSMSFGVPSGLARAGFAHDNEIHHDVICQCG